MIFVFAFVMAYKWGRTQEYFTRNEVGGGLSTPVPYGLCHPANHSFIKGVGLRHIAPL